MAFRHLWRGLSLRRRATPPQPDDVPDAAEPVNGHDVLATVARLPISTWRYAWEPPGVHHLGPMAQDWKAAFDFGQTDRRIPLVDANGVLLVSVQALHRIVTDLQTQIDELRVARDTGVPAPRRDPARALPPKARESAA